MKKLIPLLLLLAICSVQAFGGELHGTVKTVFNGDTVMITSQPNSEFKVRLKFIDAPEEGQTLFDVARQHLSDYILNKSVMVEYDGLSSDGFLTGKLYLDGNDIGLQMVRDGAAWFYASSIITAKERDAYTENEKAARVEKRGIWQDSSPIPPWEFKNQEAAKAIPQAATLSRQVSRARPSMTQLDVSNHIEPSISLSEEILSGEDYPAAARALEALRTMAGATHIGMTYDEYSSRLIDVNGVVVEALRQLPKGKLRDEIKDAIESYRDAQFVLGEMRRLDFDYIYAEGQGAELMKKYDINPVRARNGRAILPKQLILNAVWGTASTHVLTASQLLD